MPQAVLAVAAKIGVAVWAATGSAILTNIAAYGFVIGAAYLAVKSYQALMPKAGAVDVNRNAILELTTSGKQVGRVVYGRARVGGYLAAPPMVSGTNNKYLWFIVVFAAHEIDSYEKIYIGDTELDASTDFDANDDCTDAAFIDSASNKLLRVIFYDGTQTAVDPDWDAAFASVGTNHKLQGLAYCVLRLTQDETGDAVPVWPGLQPPRQFSVRIKGKKVHDSRVPTDAWSENPALCVRDYLTNTDYGLGEPTARIDDVAFEAAADICEESVTVKDNVGGTTTQDRWTCNGILSTGTAPTDNLETLASSMGGAVAFVGSGKWRAWAAAYSTPAHALDENDLSGPVKVVPQAPAENRFNLVTGNYVALDRGAVPIPFPARTNTTYETDDGGVELRRDFTYAMTDDTQRAQRLAVLALKQSRNWTTCEIRCNLRAFKVELFDTITLTIAELGWTTKVFRVIGWKYDGEAVVLMLKSDSSAAYDVTAATDLDDDPAPTTV